jgi:hypothetical protein
MVVYPLAALQMYLAESLALASVILSVPSDKTSIRLSDMSTRLAF